MSRPPRAQRPQSHQQLHVPSSPYSPSQQHQAIPQTGIAFQEYETGDRAGPLPPGSRQRRYSAAIEDPQSVGARVNRKRSLIRPERERIEPGHRQYHYRNMASQLDEHSTRNVMPSTTGNLPTQPQLRRGKSLLARDQDVAESGLSIFKRTATLRRRASSANAVPQPPREKPKRGFWDHIGPGPKDAWMIYCWILTCCIPPFLLSTFGIKTPEQQRAWREKMGLLAIIGTLMLGVGFLTFGFTITVCGKPPQQFKVGEVDNNSVIINGISYNLARFMHPKTQAVFNGTSNPLRDAGLNMAGKDVSFMFQNVNGTCRGILGLASGSAIASDSGHPHWFFPCNAFNQYGTSTVNKSGYDSALYCHSTTQSRKQFQQLLQPAGMVAYAWEDVMRSNRNLAVYQSSVLDFGLLNWLDRSQINYPTFFDQLAKPNGTFNGRDITMYVRRTNQLQLFSCLQETIQVGFIDSRTIGCVASDVVLYLSLVFIIGVVAIRFFMAVLFGWFISWRLGNFANESYTARRRRAAEIEQWTEDIYRPAPGRYRPNVQQKGNKKGTFLPHVSRFSRSDGLKNGLRPLTTYGDQMKGRPVTTYSSAENRKSMVPSVYGGRGLTPNDSGRSSASLPSDEQIASCPFPLHNVIPQPQPDWMPFNFPLTHNICLVTAYSESIEGLRTTLDSLATTDYPNSHKVILVITDGMVKGSGNDMYTPDIVLSMMKDFVVPIEEVEPHSYVAIADGHKRHNMAKVYAGFYEYDSNTVEPSKQQKVPIVLVAKVGNPLEQKDAKRGNRGKRDSQLVLMGFLQKIMFDERMTTFEYEFFNSIWRCTGVCPDKYELVLCVDADTKVFPDSLTRMTACMVNDPEIMGLCGETKIANKADSWVTMIQVFEYYISHHLTKAFESMFGGVTCLPGCFSMYRIKAPKAESGYWVPILANPDIVEHYSENIVDTLHKKNLLLLGEDRYLTTLMLKTFPKRKMVFCPQAVCKTIVPDQFGVLLSQRRRWINSTIHNLAELLLVRDLCGTFCFSMQFVVFMELAGTLVLPAAISFTVYLIISSAISGGSQNVIPLVLLAIILGIPGLLIVVTSRKIAYLGWMLVYLFSLPVWNLILPAYAFWHFDDFSWGQTRQVAGDKGSSNGDKEGVFDSSHIVMKRWAEFERERRWRIGTQSRDSTNGLNARGKRYSLISVPDTSYDPYGRPGFMNAQQHSDSREGSPHSYPRNRGDATPLLTLPAPIAVSPVIGTPSGSSSLADAPYVRIADASMSVSPSTSEVPGDPEREPTLNDANSITSGRTMVNMGPNAVIRAAPGQTIYPGETPNPYRYSQPQMATYDQAPVPQVASYGYAPEPTMDEYQQHQHQHQHQHQQYMHSPAQLTLPVPSPSPQPQQPSEAERANRRSRGYSLVDPGPVTSPDTQVRRVANRQSKRQSGSHATPRYNQRNSAQFTSSPSSPSPQSDFYLSPPQSQQPFLPPGAAPPRGYQGPQ